MKQSPIKLRLPQSCALGYGIDTQQGYEDSREMEMESEDEGFSNYMNIQAKNTIKEK